MTFKNISEKNKNLEHKKAKWNLPCTIFCLLPVYRLINTNFVNLEINN